MNNSFSMVAHKSSSDGLAYFDGVEATLFAQVTFAGRHVQRTILPSPIPHLSHLSGKSRQVKVERLLLGDLVSG
jgi:hypothetical protein